MGTAARNHWLTWLCMTTFWAGCASSPDGELDGLNQGVEDPSGSPGNPAAPPTTPPAPPPLPPPAVSDDDAGTPGEGCDAPNQALIDLEILPTCDLCDNARCVPNALVTADQRALLQPCDDANTCVPDGLAETGGTFLLKSCRSVSGSEGRCVSTCVPRAAEQADRLPQDVCEEDELCTPCFDPVTGEDTGACTQSCDPGPAEPAFTYPACCGELGACVPSDLVPDSSRALLGQLGCEDSNALCAPKSQAADPTFIAATCDSVGGAEGRCLPACLPPVADRADQLEQATCADGELCAPCYDPVTGEDTGACTQGDDAPVNPPTVFVNCCDDGAGTPLGTCVPDSLVPAEQLSLLAADTCTGEGFLCAPTPIADGTYSPRSCTSVASAEGRCLPACLPDVAAQASRLSQDVCSTGELCAPCFDPVTGSDTGACNLEGDTPQDPPTVFAGCCDDGGGNPLGTCVPTDLVPSEQVSLLDANTCTGQDVLCAPTPIAAGTYSPRTCDSVGGVEGRCLPACLPDVAAQANRLAQGVCETGELCAPCFDPLTGDNTGACDLEGDMPMNPASTFDKCCDDGAGAPLGTCVPTNLVPSEQVALLSADSCTGQDILCAPTPIADGTYAPQSCISVAQAEGRCLPACLPNVAARASTLPQASCGQGMLCAPCFDPVTGSDTGACGLEGDTPADPPFVFQGCCDDGTGNSDLGVCVPPALVPTAQQPLLGGDVCTTSGDLCAPTEVAAGTYSPKVCTSWLDGEARCLPACLPPVAADADRLTQDNCTTGELCTPCVNPLTGADTGACTIEGDAPTQNPPVVFPTCCPSAGTDRGKCVPKPLAGNQADIAPVLNCDDNTNTTGEYVCAPNEKIADINYAFPSCQTAVPDCGLFDFVCAITRSATNDQPGACLPACMLAEQAEVAGVTPRDHYLRSTCAAGEVCVYMYMAYTMRYDAAPGNCRSTNVRATKVLTCGVFRRHTLIMTKKKKREKQL